MDKGDYVLATKYHDGDPQDHWCVGFYVGTDSRGRHDIADENGKLFRGNGFRAAKGITAERGAWLLKNARLIEQSDRSLWMWVNDPMPLPEVE